jgi:uncharacterized protein
MNQGKSVSLCIEIVLQLIRKLMKKRGSIAVIAGLLILIVVVFFIFQMIPRKGPESLPENNNSAPIQTNEQLEDDGLLNFVDIEGNSLVSISIDIADNEHDRMQGLMGVTRMREDQGMLFLFPAEEPRSFWMVNTPLSLDILYVSSEKQIVKIHRHTKPYSDESLPSNSPAQYVVEVNGGFCDKYSVNEGQSVSWIRK